jgi:hypothetical protein
MSQEPESAAWWGPWPRLPATRSDVVFPTPPLPYPAAAKEAQQRKQQNFAPLITAPRAPPSGTIVKDHTLYWGISLNVHRAFFYSLLEVVPESDIFFSRFPASLRKDEFHVTLMFVGGAYKGVEGAAMEARFRSVEGQTARVEPQILLISSRLICLSVRILDPVIASLCSNRCPHVTMVLAPGTKAFQSNEELERLQSGELFARDPLAIAVPVGDGLQLVGNVQRYV